MIEDIDAHYDSAGKPIKENDLVKFRGSIYTIKSFKPRIGSKPIEIEFVEGQHTKEIATEWSVDLVQSV